MSITPMDLIGAIVEGSKTTQADFEQFLANHQEGQAKARFTQDMHEVLAGVAHKAPGANSPVVRHETPANKISLPNGMGLDKAGVLIAREHEAQSKKHWYTFRFSAKFEDGLIATEKVLQTVYGQTGQGITHFDFFGGEHPPEKMSIQVGVDEYGRPVEHAVPYTEFNFAPIDARIDFNSWADGVNNGLFELRVFTTVANETDAEGLRILVQSWLDNFSIYRGQILKYDPSGANGYGLKQVARRVDETIVYAQDVFEQLQDKVWGKMEASERLRAAGKRTDFRVLLHGPFGTGKSAGMIQTAVNAKNRGLTVIEYTPTANATVAELQKVFAVAKTYGPTVILIEDYDKFFPLEPHQMSQMTNLLDGLDKTGDVSVLATTNHLEKVEPEMIRPPRMTGLIAVKHLDRDSIEQLLHLVLKSKLADDVDFDAVWEVVQDYSPAFIRSTFDEAEAIGIQRDDDGKIGTEALVNAAQSLHEQNRVHNELLDAKNGQEEDHLRIGLRKLLGEVFEQEIAQLGAIDRDVYVINHDYCGQVPRQRPLEGYSKSQ